MKMMMWLKLKESMKLGGAKNYWTICKKMKKKRI